jgi:hypothetical protein
MSDQPAFDSQEFGPCNRCEQPLLAWVDEDDTTWLVCQCGVGTLARLNGSEEEDSETWPEPGDREGEEWKEADDGQ